MKLLSLILLALGFSIFASAQQVSSALKIEISEQANNQMRALPNATLSRIEKAVLAAHQSTLLKNSLKKFGSTTTADLKVGQVLSVKAAAYEALEIETAFSFPEDTDPCAAKLKVISYRNDTHSVRKTLVFGGAMAPKPILGVLECED